MNNRRLTPDEREGLFWLVLIAIFVIGSIIRDGLIEGMVNVVFVAVLALALGWLAQKIRGDRR